MTAADLVNRTCGWSSKFPPFSNTAPYIIRGSLHSFVNDASVAQIRAWDDAIPLLQKETSEVLETNEAALEFSAILEYKLPLEARRPDLVMLLNGTVVVVEMKGKSRPSSADLDQVAAYARDLRCYHRDCSSRPIYAVLVPTRADPTPRVVDDVIIVGPQGLDAVLQSCHNLHRDSGLTPIDASQFLNVDAYCPLPSLVRAARELLESRCIRSVWQARAATEPAVDAISQISRAAHATGTRRLVLLTGVPGAGKTLVGLRAVHSDYLDDLASARKSGRPTSPAVYLSGNGPLVEVLQYQLRDAGGGGKTFVRGVKDYLSAHVPTANKIPVEHMIVFDEAQRAFSEDMVREKHPEWPLEMSGSEPELFLQISSRIPDWSVLVGLIGTGQEIHIGEEDGILAWFDALARRSDRNDWIVHCPELLASYPESLGLKCERSAALSLNESLRFHLTSEIDQFINCVLEGNNATGASEIEARLHTPSPGYPGGIRFLVSRDLGRAKGYLRDRYADDPESRFGLVASSRDNRLSRDWGVPNDYMARSRVKRGPWYGDGDESDMSCRRLTSAVTEFETQGLELDMVLLAWGFDLIRNNGRWDIAGASKYRGSKVPVRDPMKLRTNAYRVLLTRGRDGTIVFVPPVAPLDETYEYLLSCGFRALQDEV